MELWKENNYFEKSLSLIEIMESVETFSRWGFVVYLCFTGVHQMQIMHCITIFFEG